MCPQPIVRSVWPLSPQAEQARAFAEPILAAIANRLPDFEDDFSTPGSGWIWKNRGLYAHRARWHRHIRIWLQPRW